MKTNKTLLGTIIDWLTEMMDGNAEREIGTITMGEMQELERRINIFKVPKC